MDGDQHSFGNVDEPQWRYEPGATDQSGRPTPKEKKIQWSASEFVAHNKNFGWYFLVVASGAVLAAAVYFLTRDMVSTGIIIFVAIAIAFMAAHKPRVLNYAVDNSGIIIGNKQYRFNEFKSFSVMEEGAFSSVMLLPLKRFMPPLSIYYDPKDEEQIIAMLSDYLPVEHHKLDLIDQFIKQIRL